MFAIFTLMAVIPWALLVNVNPILGIVGLAVQIIGLLGILWIAFGRH